MCRDLNKSIFTVLVYLTWGTCIVTPNPARHSGQPHRSPLCTSTPPTQIQSILLPKSALALPTSFSQDRTLP